MKRPVLSLFLALATLSGGDFIAQDEYGAKLYENPRGISCAKCHGPGGKGKVLVTLDEGKKRHTITAPNIRNVNRKDLAKSLKNRRSVMPEYHLSEAEIEALYIFLNTQK